ncbi:hypothetical protein Tco_0661383 [Tanacetum coccineum]
MPISGSIAVFGESSSGTSQSDDYPERSLSLENHHALFVIDQTIVIILEEDSGSLSVNLFISLYWFDNSSISDGANRYGDLTTGDAPGIRSMRNSISRTGGKPYKSSGNTLGKSWTTRMSSIFFSPALVTRKRDPGFFSGPLASGFKKLTIP